MAEPLTTTPAPSPAPAATAPVAAPASQTAAVPIVAEPAPVTTTPAAAPTSQAAQAPAATTPAEPAPISDPSAPAPTLLEKFDAEKAASTTLPAVAEAAATAKAAPAPAAAPAQAAPAQAPATQAAPAEAAPVEYKYTLPETITMDDALRSQVHTAFDHFRANPAEGAQELVNLHEKQMQEFANAMDKRQRDVWNETKQGWAKKVLADPELGGSGYQTTMGAVARMRDLFVAENNRAEFEDMIRTTGVGDHPAFLRMLHQAARYFDEPSLPPPNPRPPQGNGQRPSRRLRDVYDHPRSTPEGRS